MDPPPDPGPLRPPGHAPPVGRATSGGNDSPFRGLLRHSRSGCRGLGVVSVSLPQHPDEHRPERPVLLAVDQQLGEGATLRVAQNSPIRSARSKSGSIRTWSNSARGAGPRASRRCRSRHSSSGLTAQETTPTAWSSWASARLSPRPRPRLRCDLAPIPQAAPDPRDRRPLGSCRVPRPEGG
jgi:hypothetical protein